MSDQPDGETGPSVYQQFQDAMDQLERYGGAPTPEIVKILGMLSDLNDDIQHARSCHFIAEKIDQIKACLEMILVGYRP